MAVFFNTSTSGNLRVSGGGGSFILAPNQAGTLDWEGGWGIEFEDPDGSGNWVGLDSGSEGPEDICNDDPPVFPEPPEGVSYTLECAEMDATSEGIEHVFTNTGTIGLRIFVTLAMGVPGYTAAPGDSEVVYGPAGSRYELWYEDSTVSGGYRGFGEGQLSDCDEPELTYSAVARIVCAGPGVEVTNTGTGDLIAYGATIGTRIELPAGASHTFAWGTGGPNNDLLDPTGWDTYREEGRC